MVRKRREKNIFVCLEQEKKTILLLLLSFGYEKLVAVFVVGKFLLNIDHK